MVNVGDIIQVKKGLSFKLVALLNSVGLIEVTHSNTPIPHYEVWNIRENPLSWQSKGRGLYRFPSNEDFGSYGWSFSTKPIAVKFMEGLVEHGSDWNNKYMSLWDSGSKNVDKWVSGELKI